ncbi:preprotein translocase subunit SecE [Patescibacteria group bacterium]|nr:MAG: preprotein translocase subunit SecE [Patescibacteria group bacterium]
MQIVDYIKDTKGELTHVSWPSKRQAIFYTIFVVVISVVTAFFLGFFDYIFSIGLGKLIS